VAFGFHGPCVAAPYLSNNRSLLNLESPSHLPTHPSLPLTSLSIASPEVGLWQSIAVAGESSISPSAPVSPIPPPPLTSPSAPRCRIARRPTTHLTPVVSDGVLFPLLSGVGGQGRGSRGRAHLEKGEGKLQILSSAVAMWWSYCAAGCAS
jgi:hypothetical protein